MQGLAQAASTCSRLATTYAREHLPGRAVPGLAIPPPPRRPDPFPPRRPPRRFSTGVAPVEGARAFILWSGHPDRQPTCAPGDEEAAFGTRLPAHPGGEGLPHRQGLRLRGPRRSRFLGGHGYIEETGISPVRPRRPHRHDLRGRQRHPGPRPRRPQARPRTAANTIIAFFELVRPSSPPRERGRRSPEGRFPRPPQGRLEGSPGRRRGFFLPRTCKTPKAALAGSTDFLHLFGHTCLGFMWARMAQGRPRRGTDPPSTPAKLATGRYYMARQLPGHRAPPRAHPARAPSR